MVRAEGAAIMSTMDILNALLVERAARRRWQHSGDSTHLAQWLKATDNLARCRQDQAQRQLTAYQAALRTTRKIALEHLRGPSSETASHLARAICEQGRLRRRCGLAPIAVPERPSVVANLH